MADDLLPRLMTYCPTAQLKLLSFDAIGTHLLHDPSDVDDKKVQPTSGAFPNNHRLRALRWPKTTTTADEPFISLDVELCPGDPSTFSEDTWTLLAPTKDCVSFLSVPEKLRKRIPRGGVHSCSFPRSQWIAAQSQEGNHIPRGSSRTSSEGIWTTPNTF